MQNSLFLFLEKMTDGRGSSAECKYKKGESMPNVEGVHSRLLRGANIIPIESWKGYTPDDLLNGKVPQDFKWDMFVIALSHAVDNLDEDLEQNLTAWFGEHSCSANLWDLAAVYTALRYSLLNHLSIYDDLKHMLEGDHEMRRESSRMRRVS